MSYQLEIGALLVNELKRLMHFHKREASGEALESLQIKTPINRVEVWGVEYWYNS